MYIPFISVFIAYFIDQLKHRMFSQQNYYTQKICACHERNILEQDQITYHKS
jgi:hypothetical protein